MAANSQLAAVLQDIPHSLRIDAFMHERLWEMYLLYSLIGGMPEAVSSYLDNRESLFSALHKVRDIHQALIQGYGSDFSNLSSNNSGKLLAQRISSIFSSIPRQLQAVYGGSTQRFRFKDVVAGASCFKHLQDPINWLARNPSW